MTDQETDEIVQAVDRMAGPDAGLARALHAVAGDVFGDPVARWRWDGTQWHYLQPGDWCHNRRDGSAMFWNGKEFVPPRVTDGQVDDLARVLDPQAFQDHPVSPGYRIVRERQRDLCRTYARRALWHGYIPRLNPAHDPETLT